jgi:serine/threonine-protein kinase
MPDNVNHSTMPHERFEQVLAEILMEEEAGKPLDLARIVRKYPEFQKPLRAFFRDRDGFNRLAPQLAPTAAHAQPTSTPADLAPGSRFAGYEIVRELGHGGMGIVYLARQLSANRSVALKLIRMDRLEHLSPRQREKRLVRFRTEVQAAARVDDERVVPVYEVGAVDGRSLYSMRFVACRILATLLEGGPLKNRSAATLMEQTARAVQAVHHQGVLHRDLKPQNILVDGRSRPYVIDSRAKLPRKYS